VANRKFRLAFDGSHDCGRPVRAYCPTRHINPYAFHRTDGRLCGKLHALRKASCGATRPLADTSH
jgi:hypothetical protein